jgi:threonine aldolase
MTTPRVDLRSDTVTRPTPAMRGAMAAAEVGDDVFGEDPTVNALEARVAGLLGKEAALFVASGTQGNLLALLSHCRRGDEYIAGADAHAYRFEGGGGAALGGIQPQPVPFAADGTLPLADIAAVLKPDDFHFPVSRLVCLENTLAGKVLPLPYLDAFAAFCAARGLARHLDGARLFNAAVALGVPPSHIARHFDSVSVCFSKGLGAPVGSALCGPRALIGSARRLRKMLGGGMRQAGVLAAACLHALDHHVDRLAIDHARAARLGAGLAALPAFAGTVSVATNMVHIAWPADALRALGAFLATRGVLIAGRGRLVVHLDVDDAGIDAAIDACAAFTPLA